MSKSFVFNLAQKKTKPAKIAVMGQAGAGKTLSALLLAKGLTNSGKVLVFDSENGRAALKEGNPLLKGWNFYHYPVHPDQASGKLALEVVKQAEEENFDCVIIDSCSHIWDHVLETKEKLGDSWKHWATAKAPYYEFMRKGVIGSKLHIILTLRTEMKYEQDRNELTGKTQVVKLGLNPQAEKNLQFEMDFVFNIDRSHRAVCEKQEGGLFDTVPFVLEESHGEMIAQWLKTGGSSDPDLEKKRSYINRIQELVSNAEDQSIFSDLPLDNLEEKNLTELLELGQTIKNRLGGSK